MSNAADYVAEAGTPSPLFTEIDIADDFVTRHAHELRYVVSGVSG